MREFHLKSVDSDLEMLLSDLQDDYVTVQIKSLHLNALHTVYLHRAGPRLDDFLGTLAAQDRPWSGEKGWSSLECDFQLSATCSSLGKITFLVTLSNETGAEEWSTKVTIRSEFGQLSQLAKAAKAFFASPMR